MPDKDDFSPLIALLSTDKMGPECLDFIEAHGYLTAAIISPSATSEEKLLEEILGESEETLDEETTEIFRSGILHLKELISRHLLMAEALDIPCDCSVGTETEPSDLERWCMAFTEKHFMSEEEWFSVDESAAANMLLPIICGSGLVDDPELLKIRAQPELFMSMLEDIPDIVVDMYAFYHES